MTANPERVDHMAVRSVTVGKAYAVFERRNEWVDWNGNTDSVLRAYGLLPSLTEAESWAERHRKPGSSFVIRETLCAVINFDNDSAVIGQRGSSDAITGLIKKLTQITPIESFEVLVDRSDLNKSQRIIFRRVKGKFTPAPLSEYYYERESSPGRGQNHLGWNLRQIKLDANLIQTLASELTRLLIRSIQ